MKNLKIIVMREFLLSMFCILIILPINAQWEREISINEIDDFTGKKRVYSNYETYRGQSRSPCRGVYKTQVGYEVGESDTTYYFKLTYFTVGEVIYCFNSSSYVSIKFEQEVITLDNSLGVQCEGKYGTLYFKSRIPSDKVILFRTSPVEKMRIGFVDGYVDIEGKNNREVPSTTFIRAFKLIDEI